MTPTREPTLWQVPDDLWLVAQLQLQPPPHRTGGRLWSDTRRVLDGVLYVLRTGCQ